MLPLNLELLLLLEATPGSCPLPYPNPRSQVWPHRGGSARGPDAAAAPIPPSGGARCVCALRPPALRARHRRSRHQGRGAQEGVAAPGAGTGRKGRCTHFSS